MADEEFDFEAEFSLLDIGATSSLLRSGSVRPTVLAFTAASGVESVSLCWDDSTGPAQAFEEARRYLRDQEPEAYAVVAHISRSNGTLSYLLPENASSVHTSDFLAVALFARDGSTRAVTYPIRHTGGRVALGMPAVTDADTTDWRPLGDIWNNPFCVGDVARFRTHDRPVDPATPLWTAIVELTRLRIHEDQRNADEYMSFLDDLRNGVFLVAGRPESEDGLVLLRPRTTYNPVGTLSVEASRLLLSEPAAADITKVPAR